MVVPYSTINLWFYVGLLYYGLGEVGLRRDGWSLSGARCTFE